MQVRLEPAFGFVIGVRHVVANEWTLAGNLANLGHDERHGDSLYEKTDQHKIMD